MTDKLQEDTVSADRKERIIYDPEAWRKGKKSGKKTSSITSRQNFDNEKFTRKAGADDKVDESIIQPSGSSKVEGGGPEQSDTISKDAKVKKSNNPQIEFVTGTATPNGSSSTAIGNAQNMGIKKMSESLIEKAIKQVKSDSDVPFDGPYTKPGDRKDEFGNTVKAKNIPGFLAKRAMRKVAGQPPVKEEVQPVEEGVAGAVAGGLLGAALGPIGVAAGAYLGHKTQQGANAAKDTKKKVNKEEADMSLNKEGWDPEQFGSDGSGAGRPGGAGAGDIGKTDKKKKSAKPIKEGAKTYSQFVEELDELVEFVVEETQLQEYNAKDGVYRHKGTYGGGYVDPEGSDDADDKPKAAPAPAVKKGRGRPSGSYGTYKARSAETKAAAAAKSAASKAANKAK